MKIKFVNLIGCGFCLLPWHLAAGEVVVYEGDTFPEELGWTRDFFCSPERFLDNGLLVLQVDEPGECSASTGDNDIYLQSFAQLSGVPDFFYEFRVRTEGIEEKIPFVAPVDVAISGSTGVRYSFTVANDRAELFRDVLFPTISVDLIPDIFHTVRLEHFGAANYVAYIDGQIIDQGIPEGQYPSTNAITGVLFESEVTTHTSWLDYIRYGRITVDGSADFNSDGAVDTFDHFYISECIDRSAAGESAEPSCTWADINDDNTVDCTDWDAIASSLWTGLPGDPPFLSACDGAPVPATSAWGSVVITLLVVTVATVIGARRIPTSRLGRN